jgi:hypothetical protein
MSIIFSKCGDPMETTFVVSLGFLHYRAEAINFAGVINGSQLGVIL